MVCFSVVAAQELELHRLLAAENTGMAEALADELDASARAQNALVAMGREEFILSESLARLLAEERMARKVSNGGLTLLAVLALLVGAMAD